METRKCTLAAAALVLILALAVSGCFVVALSPWFGTEAVVTDKGFEGLWKTDDDEWLEVTPADVEYGGSTVKGYKLQYRSCGRKDEPALFGVIGQVGKHRYMSYVSPEDDMDKLQGIPAFMLTRLSIDGDLLMLGHLSRTYVEELWRKRMLGLSFVCSDKNGVRQPSRGEARLCDDDVVLLTEDRAALQDFLVRNQDDASLFDKPEKPAVRITEPPCGKEDRK